MAISAESVSQNIAHLNVTLSSFIIIFLGYNGNTQFIVVGTSFLRIF